MFSSCYSIVNWHMLQTIELIWICLYCKMSLSQKHDHFLADILSFIDWYLNCIFVDKIKIMLVITYKISDAFISKGKISVFVIVIFEDLNLFGSIKSHVLDFRWPCSGIPNLVRLLRNQKDYGIKLSVKHTKVSRAIAKDWSLYCS